MLNDLTAESIHMFLLDARLYRTHDYRYSSKAQVKLYKKMSASVIPDVWKIGEELIGSVFVEAMLSKSDLKAHAARIRALYVILSSVPTGTSLS